MKISSDDPKLTAYALGELDKGEAEQIERELQNNPKLRKTIAEVRETAVLLKRELSNEPALSLSETQKGQVLAKTKPDNIILFPRQKIFTAIGIGAIAASIAFVVTWQFGVLPQKTKKNRQTISNSDYKYAQNAVSQAHKKTVTDEEKVESEKAQIPVQGNQTGWSASLGGLTTLEGEVSPSQLVEMQIPVGNPAVLKNALTQPSTGTGVDGGGDGQVEPRIPSVSETKVNSDQSAPKEVANRTYYDKNRNLGNPEWAGILESPKPSPSQDRFAGRYASTESIKDFNSLETSQKSESAKNYSYDNKTYPRKLAPVDLAESEAVRRQSYPVDYSVEVRSTPPTAKQLRKVFQEQERLKRYENYSSETARYPKYAENDFQSVAQEPLSTFSIDVDTASYANVRRFLNENRLPPGDAVRIEELINYFSYNYPQPKDGEPFSANLEVAGCPWNSQHRLVRIGLKGKEIAQDKRPPSNFVFLIDVSGSMSPSERLPLIKQALRMLVKRMTENDRIAIVVYASSSGVVLESTSCANKEKILEALDRLEAGGSTNGGEGVQRAYALAEENFLKGGVNRVILCTDGDFNVGITDQSELVNLIQRKARSGVFLSALGVGTDNYKDALMQKLADKGNGNYHYIDTMEEAQKVLIQQMNGTLVTIAKDVKIQIEFNPAQVSSYRLIGYEKRILAAEDFNNDKKDAGEIGAGHTVTALYEIVPAGGEETESRGAVDDLKYQKKPVEKPKRVVSGDSKELLTLKLRYKKPDGNVSKLSEFALTDGEKKFSQASTDFRFASAVAGFGMILKNSEHKGEWTFKSVLDVAETSKGEDKEGYRAEFINLVKKAKSLHQRD